jgi:hypothetical protein
MLHSMSLHILLCGEVLLYFILQVEVIRRICIQMDFHFIKDLK